MLAGARCGAKLTKKAVDGAAPDPGGKDRFPWDAEIEGFAFEVTPAGSKVYVLQYRTPQARTQRFTIGPPNRRPASPVAAEAIAFGPLVCRRRPMPQAVLAWDDAGAGWREDAG